MMIIVVLLSAVCAALSNLFFRLGTTDTRSNSYLLLYYFSSLILSFLFYPNILAEEWDLTMLGIGTCVGLLNTLLMLVTARALRTGPAGLVFAFQITSNVFPAMILYTLFGSHYGFSFSNEQFMGISLVVLGLFLGAKNKSESKSGWLKYAIMALGIQSLALTLLQGRCLFSACYPHHAENFTLAGKDDVWFMIGQFGAASIVQLAYIAVQKQLRGRQGIYYGTLGGIANFACTVLLLVATKYALPDEQAILLPCFAVATIILCNLWAKFLYQEKFHALANFVCTCGIVLGVK